MWAAGRPSSPPFCGGWRRCWSMCGRVAKTLCGVVRSLCAFALLTTLAGCCWTSSTRGATAELPALPVLTSLQRLEHNGTPGLWMDSRDAGTLALWIRTATGEAE